jgi:hypothetical protein
LHTARELAAVHMSEAHRKTKRQYDARRKDVSYEKNDLVKVKAHPKSNQDRGIAAKLAQVFQGPYRVVERKGPLTYKLADVRNPDYSMVVNVCNIRPYFHRDTCVTLSHSEVDTSEGPSDNTASQSESNWNEETDSMTHDSASGRPRLRYSRRLRDARRAKQSVPQTYDE